MSGIRNSGIEVKFSYEIDPKTVDSTTFFVTVGGRIIPGVINIPYSGMSATFYSRDTTYPYAGLIPNTTYTATVTSGVKTLTGGSLWWAYSWNFHTEAKDIKAPSIPNLNYATLLGMTVYLHWSESIDNKTLFGYRIYRNGVLLQDTRNWIDPEYRYYEDKDLVSGSTYCYSVSAHDWVENESAKSSEICVTVP